MKTLAELYADSKVNAFQKSVGIGTTPILGVARNRLAVHFYYTAADYFVTPSIANAATAFGAKVTSGNDQHFTLQEHGDLPTNEWAVVAAAPATVQVVEVLANCPCGTGH